jgi:hypothetical protein
MSRTIVFPDAAAERDFEGKLRSGLEVLARALELAEADIAVADDLRVAAEQLKAAALEQAAVVAAFVPGTTFKQSDLVAVRNQMGPIIQRQAIVLEALADSYTYRAAVDRNAVQTNRSLLWLVRYVTAQLDDTTPEEPTDG